MLTSGFQAGELATFLERIRKSKEKTDGITEDKLIELLKKGENEEIVRILTAESASFSLGSEKGFSSPESLCN